MLMKNWSNSYQHAHAMETWWRFITTQHCSSQPTQTHKHTETSSLSKSPSQKKKNNCLSCWSSWTMLFIHPRYLLLLFQNKSPPSGRLLLWNTCIQKDALGGKGRRVKYRKQRGKLVSPRPVFLTVFTWWGKYSIINSTLDKNER